MASNVTFCVSPWTHMQHGADGSTMLDFVGGPLYGPPALPTTRRIESMYQDLGKLAPNEFYDLVRRHYYSSPRPPLRYFAPNETSIAVHVRRGDIKPETTRWVEISDVSACIDVMQQKLGGNASVHIFSDGTYEQLASLQRHRPALHLRDNVRVAFHHMVEASNFITAPSSLSGTISILRTHGITAEASRGSACLG
eukprot:CAMPEP_0181178554 /NCGR_PEP_ID=MMETSP1096-20121128/5782_1 /TAXON_ID=156174 ORGANISM="Chrysochromulina ericina, Strain CCMP281" /NCGR_SAMPLE_ID=MMETSP1096 /ASSEMBLY_ACC=CAM_ASM_000453 /LENGTH=195 /DNA_ID=CAMNT_0023266831 /DNA_START=101 /DNA_END=688 /DNA_ORIENTATION=-